MFVSNLKNDYLSERIFGKAWHVCCLLMVGLSFTGTLRAASFDFDDLEPNRSVTLPHPATTLVNLPNSLMLSSTDRGQSLKLQAAARSQNLPMSAFQVAIFDPNAEGVRYVKVSPGQPVLYNFKSLGSIRLSISLPDGAPNDSNTRLQIESNRPLELRKGGR